MKFLTYTVSKLRNDFFQYLIKAGFLKDFTALAGVAAVGKTFSVLASFISARLYTPADFGILSIFASIAAQLLVLSCLRYEWAIPLPKDEQTAIDLVIICFVIITSITLIVAIGTITAGHQISIWLNEPALEPFLFFLPLTLFFAGCYQALSYWIIRQKAFGLLAQTKLTQSLLTSTSQILMGLLTTGPLGLLIGFSLHSGVGTERLAVRFWKDCKVRLRNLSIPRLIRVGCQYYKFPTRSVWSSFFNSAGLVAPALLLAYFYNSEAVGSFALVQRLISIPSTLIAGSISKVFLANASSLIRNNPSQLKKLYSRIAILLFCINVLLSLGLLTGPWSFPLIFGARWHESGIMAQHMALMFIAAQTVSPLSILDWIEKQGWMLIWNMSRLILICLGFLLSDIASWSATSAVTLLSCIMALMYGLLLIINLYALHLIVSRQTPQSISKNA